MLDNFRKLNKQPVHIAMLLVFLTAPYFYIRQSGFDFSKGSSFSLVDFFLLTSIFVVAYNFFTKRFSFDFNKHLRNMLIIGSMFTALCLLSGITAPMFAANDHVNWRTLISGAMQYSFIFIAFPLLVAFFISSSNVKTAIRYIALGYIPPMIINILLAPEAAFPNLREMFFSANRAMGTYGNANSLAEVLLITLPFYIYLIATEKGFWQKVGYIGLIAVLDCLFLYGSFSGFIARVVIAIANFVLLAMWKKHPLRAHMKKILQQSLLIFFMFACSYVALSYYAPYVVGKILERIIPAALEPARLKPATLKPAALEPTVLEQTVNTRMELNYRALDKIKERSGGLFYGHGLRQTSSLPEFNFGGNGLDVHLLYLLLWAEGGFILAATFGWYLLLLLRNCVNLAKTHPAEAVAIGTAVLSLALFGLFLPHAYLRYFWVPLLPAFVTTKENMVTK